MSRGSRSRLALAALLSGLDAAALTAQAWTPNTRIEVPAADHFCLDGEFSWYRPESFVDRDGTVERFPGGLDFLLGVFRASYTVWHRLALGVEVPYRAAEYDDPGLEASYSARGLPGIGAFVDWAPGNAAAALRPALRFEIFFSRSEQDQVVNVRDGANRYSLALQLGQGDAVRSPTWRYWGNLRLEYAPSIVDRDRLLEGRLEVLGGPRVASLFGQGLYALILGGYRTATAALQEANFFGNRTSQNGFAGILVDWGPHSANEVPPLSLSVSAVHDFRPRNSLSGWRTTLTFVAGL
jgi:hypothetical protein